MLTKCWHRHVDPAVQSAPVGTTSTTTTTSGATTSSTTTASTTTTGATTSTNKSVTTSTGGGASTGTVTTTTSKNASPATTSAQTSNGSIISSPDNASSTSSHVSVGAVAGGVVGGIAVLALLTILFFLCRRRKRRQEMIFPETGAPASPMQEMDRNHQATIVSPFTLSPSQVGLISISSQPPQRGYYGHVPTASQTSFRSPPLSRSDNMSAYGGYVDPSSSGSGSAAGYHGQPLYGQMVSVTPFDHLSYGAESDATSPTHTSSTVEATRRARQNELDQQLRSIQQEMMYLSSDVRNGEKGARHHSVRRRQTLDRGAPIAEAEEPEGEISMEEMQEQLRNMRAQIAYLQEQQRSAWAQGLTDDPPPGYSPAVAA